MTNPGCVVYFVAEESDEREGGVHQCGGGGIRVGIDAYAVVHVCVCVCFCMVLFS